MTLVERYRQLQLTVEALRLDIARALALWAAVGGAGAPLAPASGDDTGEHLRAYA